MRALVTKKLTVALRRISFCSQRKNPHAKITSAAPVPMGAAYSPSPSDREPMFRMPPLRRVWETVSDTGTPEASHSGMFV